MSGFLSHTQTKTTSDGLLQDELLLYVEYKLLLPTIWQLGQYLQLRRGETSCKLAGGTVVVSLQVWPQPAYYMWLFDIKLAVDKASVPSWGLCFGLE